MVFKLLFGLLFSTVIVFSSAATTLHLSHNESSNIKLQSAVYGNRLDFSPKFEYPTETVFELREKDINFYSLKVNSSEYYLWFEKSSKNIEIDLSLPRVSSSNFILVSKVDWYLSNFESNNPSLLKLNEIDIVYRNALNSLMDLAHSDEKFRAEKDYGTIVWNSRAAKRLYNFAVEEMNYQIDEKWVHVIPSYTDYWDLMYQLFYQYFHVNSFKGINKSEIKTQIEEDFDFPESKHLVFHHFFRKGLSSTDLEENYKLLEKDLEAREKDLAKAFIQQQTIKELSNQQNIAFLFGIDIDGALQAYFARDTTDKKNVLVFWSFWDGTIDLEFNLLHELKDEFQTSYNFVHICIDSYEAPEKANSFINQKRVSGLHLLPQESNAFKTSTLRKDQKIRNWPFYLLTDAKGEVIDSESVPLRVSLRLQQKLKFYETKK